MSDKADEVVAALRKETWILLVHITSRSGNSWTPFEAEVRVSGSESRARCEARDIAENGFWHMDNTFIPARRIDSVQIHLEVDYR